MNATIQKDFADWLSPILVKEMRQGLRSRIFVTAFLLMQGLMIFCVILGLATADDSFDASSGFFWTMIGIPLLLLMPARGFGVLGGEIKGNTLELIFLTRLSAWRIVAGKWAAILAQTLLLACSVLPYTVLRYFLGGINLLDDLQVLAVLLVISAILTAIAVGLSPFHRAKAAQAGGSVIFIWLALMLLQSRFFFGGMGPRSSSTDFYAITGVIGPLFLLLMFEIAVGRIAPPAENHAFRKRLLGFLILAALALLHHFHIDTDALRIIGILLLLPVCVTALCEEIKPIPSIYLPFVKRGFFGKLAGLVFYPGWAGGLIFTAVALAGMLAIFFDRRFFVDEGHQLLLVSFLGGLLMPLAIIRTFFEKRGKTFVIYLGMQTFMFVAMLLTTSLKGSVYANSMKLVCPLPTSVFFLGLFERIERHHEFFFLAASSLVLAMSLLLLLLKLPGQWRRIAALEMEAREQLAKPVELQSADANPA